jgi:hypothetical protein
MEMLQAMEREGEGMATIDEEEEDQLELDKEVVEKLIMSRQGVQGMNQAGKKRKPKDDKWVLFLWTDQEGRRIMEEPCCRKLWSLNKRRI